MLMLDRQVLVARMFPRDRDWRLVGRLSIDLAIVERIPAEQVVAALETVIDAPLREVLVGRLRPREEVFGSPAAERAAVGTRKERLEIRGNGWMQRDGARRKDAVRALSSGTAVTPVMPSRSISDSNAPKKNVRSL